MVRKTLLERWYLNKNLNEIRELIMRRMGKSFPGRGRKRPEQKPCRWNESGVFEDKYGGKDTEDRLWWRAKDSGQGQK